MSESSCQNSFHEAGFQVQNMPFRQRINVNVFKSHEALNVNKKAKILQYLSIIILMDYKNFKIC